MAQEKQKKIAKVVVAMKVDPARKLDMERQAKAQCKTMTDLLVEGFDSAGEIYQLRNKLEDQQQQIQELVRKYQAATGKKVNTTKRLSIPVTDQEWTAITKAAIDAKMAKGEYMRLRAGLTRPAEVAAATRPALE